MDPTFKSVHLPLDFVRQNGHTILFLGSALELSSTVESDLYVSISKRYMECAFIISVKDSCHSRQQ